jgi:dipeptidyl aminopeptidase/acylaminoacyl peptidase
VYVLKALAASRPYIDLTRVGVTGVSNGGYASLRAMLAFPDFFTVCVSANGSHDLRKYMVAGGMNQAALGDDDFTGFNERANQGLANRLRGKLLLILGGFDMNVPNADTYGVVQSLFEAGKNFDLAVVPRMGHSISHDPFALRKQWDYFVEHLLGESPPQDYVVPTPEKPAPVK